jgi:GxxExxY protein
VASSDRTGEVRAAFPVDEDERLVAIVAGCSQLVLRRLGPGRARLAYARALIGEFTRRRIPFQAGAKLPLFRHGVRLDAHAIIELCVWGRVIVDIVTCDHIRAEHCIDLRRRLHFTGTSLGVVASFGSARLMLGRVVVRRVGAFCLNGRTVKIARQRGAVCRLEPPC